VRIDAIGWRAEAALRDGDGRARVLAALTASVYLDVGGEVVWLARPGAVAHARAIHVAPETSVPLSAVDTADVLRRARASGVRPWRPDAAPATAGAAAALRRGAARLAASVPALGSPRGLGAWLVGAPPSGLLAAAWPRADALAHACAADNPVAAVETATALVGLGPGLTPAGDDFVGGAFFARAVLARAGAVDAAAWQAAASAVATAAARLTHPIGAALLGDLVRGEGWAPLHELATALARDDDAAALDAARRLTRLGHSSGWDLLAGFVAGARG